MSTTHSCVAEIFTQRLSPVEEHGEESAAERGRRALEESWSLRRLAARLFRRLRGQSVQDPSAELEAAVMRLSELSPHLLVDVGIDPETGAMLAEGAMPVRRPVRVAAPLPLVEPEAAAPVRKPARLRLHIRVLPDAPDTAEPLRA